MVEGEFRSTHHNWSTLSREIGAPPADPKDLAPWHCPECNGRRSTFVGLGTKEVGDEIKPELEARPCEACSGWGLVCPYCRGARIVKVRVGADMTTQVRSIADSPILRRCKGCSVDGVYNREREAEAIRSQYREAVLEKQVELEF